jgi:hypothetical protein
MEPSTNHKTPAEDDITYPEKFPSLIADFAIALTTTFPEFSSSWSKYNHTSTTELEWLELYNYCLDVYPERFFDILYQNDDIFTDPTAQANVHFLPKVDFGRLYNSQGVSKNTQTSIWKYLQLILFSVIGDIKDSEQFGASANLFQGIKDEDLQEKLANAMTGISDYFQKMDEQMKSESDSCKTNMETELNSFTEKLAEASKEMGLDFDMSGNMPDEEAMKHMQENMNQAFKKIFGDTQDTQEPSTQEPNTQSNGEPSNNTPGGFSTEDMPNADNIHDHLKGLFGGKLGSLASELMEELTQDLEETLGFNPENMSSDANPQDVFKKLMRHPDKFMNIVKKIQTRFQDKMQSGDLSQDEIMKEAGEMLKKMKDMGGNSKEMKEMFKNMAQTMGGGAGMEQMAGMFGKNTRVDTNAIDRMVKMQSTKDRIRAKLARKKEQDAIARQNQNQNYVLEQHGSDPNRLVYRSLTGENQERSSIRPITEQTTQAELDLLVADIEGTGSSTVQTPQPSSKKSKSKNKKKK